MKRGRKLNAAEPMFKFSKVILNTETKFGQQLKPFRVAMGYTLREFADLSGIELTLISHFECNTGPLKSSRGYGWNDTTVKYLKALGARQVIINL
jgi:hypothetical protein